MDFRKLARWVVNLLALVAAILTLPQLGAVVPPDWLPEIASVTAILNLILTWLRRLAPGETLTGLP